MKKLFVVLCGFASVGLYGAAAGEGYMSGNVKVGNDNLKRFKKGTNNTAIGESSLSNLEEGNANIALGVHAGMGLKKGSSNIYIGATADETEENKTIVIGFSQNQVSIPAIRNSKRPGKNHRVVVIDEEGWLTAVPFEEFEKLTRSAGK